MTVYLIDRSTSAVRSLSLYDYLQAIQHQLDAGYFVAWSKSAAECQQRAVFAEVARESSLTSAAQNA